MNNEPFETAVCAASDLAARLARELAQAVSQLEHAEQCLAAAAVDAEMFGAPIPFRLRKQRNESRREVAVLRHVLSGMPCTDAGTPDTDGGRHAASA